MAIVFDTSSLTGKSTKYLYSDLDLDLTKTVRSGRSVQETSTSDDIVLLQDMNSIKNSVFNMISISRGERKMSPAFGLDLADFLGRPVDQMTAGEIGDRIKTGIEKWEPRTKVRKIAVIPYPDQLAYYIFLFLYVPTLSKEFDMRMQFGKAGLVLDNTISLQ